MIITGAFIAEKAAVLDNKLQVWGGVLDTWTVGPDRRAEFAVVTLLQTEAGETNWSLGLQLRTPSGEAHDLPPFEVAANVGENRFACPTLGFALPQDGRHVIIVTAISSSGEQSSAAIPFVVLSAQ